jgi:hypothetical protein
VVVNVAIDNENEARACITVCFFSFAQRERRENSSPPILIMAIHRWFGEGAFEEGYAEVF